LELLVLWPRSSAASYPAPAPRKRLGTTTPLESLSYTYDPSVLRRVQYMLYEIKWSNNKRPQQSCCHRTGTKHAEIYFLEDVFRKERSDPSAHCFITWFMSWSPCGYCCKEIRGFLKDQPNVNLVIYVARIYWHKREINLLGLRSLMNIGVSIRWFQTGPKTWGIPQWDSELFPFRSLVSNLPLSASDQKAIADSHFLTYLKCAGVCSPAPSSTDKNH
uniref:CMP/dCMP-type deaminase domain-containing protein n=1 Tax=Chelonoidis abingdonii TaxID=106734 RepID=A0A8C0ISX4_CHEAB